MNEWKSPHEPMEDKPKDGFLGGLLGNMGSTVPILGIAGLAAAAMWFFARGPGLGMIGGEPALQSGVNRVKKSLPWFISAAVAGVATKYVLPEEQKRIGGYMTLGLIGIGIYKLVIDVPKLVAQQPQTPPPAPPAVPAPPVVK